MARCASIRTLVAAAALGLLLLALAPTTLGRGLQQSPSPSPPQGAPADAFAPNGATDPFAASLPPPTSTPESQFGLAPGIGQPGGEPRRNYTGVATVAYQQDPLDAYGAVKLGCGLGFVSPTFQSNYVGVSNDLFAAGMACGRCITIQCDDTSCTEPGKRDLPALVADMCGSCTKADLSISAPLFRNLTGRDPGSNPSVVVSWDVAPCAPYTQGTIKLLVRPKGSAFFQSFGLSNYAQPITAVQINGQRLQHTTSNSWDWNPGQPITPTDPLDVALMGANREVLRARVPSLKSADLGVQFKAA